VDQQRGVSRAVTNELQALPIAQPLGVNLAEAAQTCGLGHTPRSSNPKR